MLAALACWPTQLDSSRLPRRQPEAEAPRRVLTAVDPCKVVVVGSSVAAGLGSKDSNPDKGWGGPQLLGAALSSNYGLSLVNVAVSGTNVNTTMAYLEDALTVHKPRVVIFGLSLANEGLRDDEERSQAVATAEHYMAGLLTLAQTAELANATVVIGGVYPHDSYTVEQVEVLSETDATLKAWPYEYLDFLSATSDGNGDWKSELRQNNGHPNDAGHLAMYNAIALAYFAQFACLELPPPSPPPPSPPPPSPSPSPPPPSPPSPPSKPPPVSPWSVEIEILRRELEAKFEAKCEAIEALEAKLEAKLEAIEATEAKLEAKLEAIHEFVGMTPPSSPPSQPPSP